MARSYGQIMSAIWKDQEFRALSGAAQRIYLMLVTQADISSAGTLPLTVRRWAAYAADTTPDALSDALSELVAKRFVVLDESTEELLVRTFVKWDGGFGNEKRRRAITAAANAVTSPVIGAALAAELDALGVGHSIADAVWDALSDAISHAPPDTTRVVVTTVSTDHNPEPDPQPATRTPSAAERPDVERICQHLADRIEANGSKRPTVSARWYRAGRLLLDADGHTEQQVHNAIDWCQADEFWRANVLSMPKLREKYDQMRLAAQRPRGGRASPARSTTDLRVEAGSELARRLREQESA